MSQAIRFACKECKQTFSRPSDVDVSLPTSIRPVGVCEASSLEQSQLMGQRHAERMHSQ